MPAWYFYKLLRTCVLYLSPLIAPPTQGKHLHEFCFGSKSWIEGSKLCANFTPLVPPRLPPSPSSNKSNVVKSAARSRAPGGRCQGGALSRLTNSGWSYAILALISRSRSHSQFNVLILRFLDQPNTARTILWALLCLWRSIICPFFILSATASFSRGWVFRGFRDHRSPRWLRCRGPH